MNDLGLPGPKLMHCVEHLCLMPEISIKWHYVYSMEICPISKYPDAAVEQIWGICSLWRRAELEVS